MKNHWKPDEFSQAEPDYDGCAVPDPVSTEEKGVVNTPRKRSGKITTEGNRRKVARWRARHGSQYRAYMREYMRIRRAQQKAQDYAVD